jgi:hypothetical protein
VFFLELLSVEFLGLIIGIKFTIVGSVVIIRVLIRCEGNSTNFPFTWFLRRMIDKRSLRLPGFNSIGSTGEALARRSSRSSGK